MTCQARHHLGQTGQVFFSNNNRMTKQTEKSEPQSHGRTNPGSLIDLTDEEGTAESSYLFMSGKWFLVRTSACFHGWSGLSVARHGVAEEGTFLSFALPEMQHMVCHLSDKASEKFCAEALDSTADSDQYPYGPEFEGCRRLTSERSNRRKMEQSVKESAYRIRLLGGNRRSESEHLSGGTIALVAGDMSGCVDDLGGVPSECLEKPKRRAGLIVSINVARGSNSAATGSALCYRQTDATQNTVSSDHRSRSTNDEYSRGEPGLPAISDGVRSLPVVRTSCIFDQLKFFQHIDQWMCKCLECSFKRKLA
nr:hypothetical protein Iba_chr09bCG7020 [Ipomoea batatas]